MINKYKNQKAITLVALVITIIIVLILAGITISSLTNTGIFIKTKKAVQTYKEAEEKEILQTELYNLQISKNSNEKLSIGEYLYDKNVENGSKWHIIVMNDSKQIYGTGWLYVRKDSKIDKVIIKNDWLINESNSEMIKLDDKSFTELSYESAVGVTDGLIFNLDPSVIENATKENINEQLGDNVELVNFDWNENSGLTKKSFNFDGVNDYIKIKYDNDEEKNILAQRGLTFEFYGIYDGGTSYNEKNEIFNHNYKGIFCYWNGDESRQATLRFGIRNNKQILWNTGDKSVESDYSEPGYPWNIIYPKSDEIQNNKKIHFVISIDCTQETYKHVLYVNGNKLYDGVFNKECWSSFVDKYLNNLKIFCIGRSSMNKEGQWHYSKMNAYSIKLYNRGLNEQEVKENYNKAVAYHNLL